MLDPFADYLHTRYDAGLENARALERALRPLGFRGSYPAVGRSLRRLRRTRPRDRTPLPRADRRPDAFTPREAVWLLQTVDTDLSGPKCANVAALTARSPALHRVRDLALAFRALFRTHDANALRPWLAAVLFPWSTGSVAGHVHRLKAVKRSIYGRAHFDLLRACVVHAA